MTLDLMTQSPEGLLTIMQLRGVGPQIARRLASLFEYVAEIPDADEGTLRGVATNRVLNTIREQESWTIAHEQAHRLMANAFDNDVAVISFFDSQYPALLRHIPDPPPILYVKGQLRASIRNVACVGTRNTTTFGIEVARRVTKLLVDNEYSIVSGLALGIDAESHQAALANGGHTVAILANGLDSVYPAKHRDLAQQILEQGGALLSEQPPGARAFAQNLIQRDRLQCGMSLATFVMQTDVVGGTMHTVRFTLEQGRILYVPVPPGQYAQEEQNRGIQALSEQTGRELVDTLNARDSFRDLLISHYGDRLAARPITGQDDYKAVLQELRAAEQTPMATRTISDAQKRMF